jgi:arylsulfatase A-like enzyme
MLGAYGGTEFTTPNLDRFAERSARFTSHVTGSLPCMPARHDLLVGSLDFLWRPWGSIELWEEPITATLRHHDVVTMLVTDHPHLFETGGENYHTDFSAWDYVRGHESDPWRTHTDQSSIGAHTIETVPQGWFWQRLGAAPMAPWGYDRSRTFFRGEQDFPGPRTMTATAQWLRDAAPQHTAAGKRWLCVVDEFDPHEPFDVPQEWLGRYDPSPVGGPRLIWPPYIDGGKAKGLLSDSEAVQLRGNYGAKLSMIDHWFGEILRAFDDGGLWETTALIVCTDHGHYLGEERGGNDIWGKPRVPQFEPLGHIPLLIHWPGLATPIEISALTTTVDLHATLCDVFDAQPAHQTHGASLVPLLTGTATSIREWAIGGVYGSWVQVTDGRCKYARAPEGDGFPLSMWSNRWSTMPVHVPGIVNLPKPDGRAWLDRMPGSEIPVIRQPFAPGDLLPMWAGTEKIIGRHHLYDLSIDPDEQENRARQSDPTEAELIDLLHEALRSTEAPKEQFDRLGMS